MSVIFGVDVSSGQGTINWGQVAAWTGAKGGKIRFAIAKATEGHTYRDPLYTHNRSAIPAAGIIPGAYHFLRPLNKATIEDQADWFCNVADPNAMHCLDVEAPGPLDVKGWVARYRHHYPTKTLWIYTGPGMWKTISLVPYDGAPFGPLWAAGDRPGHYLPADGLDVETAWLRVTGNTGLPWLGWTEWSIMQFASGYVKIPGITGQIDVNTFGGTEDDLRAMINGSQEAGLSAAEVDQINAHTDAAFRANANAFAAALLATNLGTSGPNVAVALQSGYQNTQKIVAQTDTVEASLEAITVKLDAIADAVAAALSTGTGTSVDAGVVKSALVEVLGSVRLTQG